MTVDVYIRLYKVVKKYSVSNMLYKTIKKKKNKKIIKYFTVDQCLKILKSHVRTCDSICTVDNDNSVPSPVFEYFDTR